MHEIPPSFGIKERDVRTEFVLLVFMNQCRLFRGWFWRGVLLATFFGTSFSCAFAANEQTVRVIGGPVSLSELWGGALNTGSLAEWGQGIALHRMETDRENLTLLSGGTLSFSFAPDKPTAFLRGGIFSGTTVVGSWAESLERRDVCDATPANFSAGEKEYSFALCGKKPSVSLQSSDENIVSCSGMSCVAHQTGSVRITATIAPTQTVLWAKQNTETNWQKAGTVTLSEGVLSWPVSVASPPTLSFSMKETNPLPFGSSATLVWSAENAVRCEASGAWQGTRELQSGGFSTGPIFARRDYGLRCWGSGDDTVEKTVSVLVGSPTRGPVVTLTAGSTLIPYGSDTILSWSSENADVCQATGAWVNPGPGTRAPTGSQSTGNLRSDKTYIIECYGSGGSQAKQITVHVIPPSSKPSIQTFSASPVSVVYNKSTTLSWTTQSAASCRAYADPVRSDWDGTRNIEGKETISGLLGTTRFFLECTGAGGKVVKSVDVKVEPQDLPPPTLSFSADESALPYGGSTVLRWESRFADTCRASLDWSGEKERNGSFSQNIGPLSTSKRYQLFCENAAGSVTALVQVFVGDPTGQVRVSLSADQNKVSLGGRTTVRWTTENASTCILNKYQSGTSQIVSRELVGSASTGTLTSSIYYTLTCSNKLGIASASEPVVINLSPGGTFSARPLISFQRDAGYISYNTPTTLRWKAEYADFCEASSNADTPLENWNGRKDISGVSSTGNLIGTTRFTLTCHGSGGTSSASVTATVGDPSQTGPSLKFWADSFTVNPGESTTLRWESTDATRCSASAGWSGSKGTNSGQVYAEKTRNLTETTTFLLSCSSPGGGVSLSVTIFVGSSVVAPSLSLWADAAVVNPGESTILRWSSSSATSCRAFSDPESPLWSGEMSFAGARRTGPLTGDPAAVPPRLTQTYRLVCEGPGGEVSTQTTIGIGVASGIGPEITNFSADAFVIPFDTAPTLRLSSNNADACCLTTDTPDACWDSTRTQWMELPSTNGTFSGPQGILPLRNEAKYQVVCRNASLPGIRAVSPPISIDVGKLLLCPATPPANRVSVGDTIQLSAHYTTDPSATCLSGDRGVDVTSGATWEVMSGNERLSLEAQKGLFRGVRVGIARVRVSYLPTVAVETFRSEADILVFESRECYRCDSETSRCGAFWNPSTDTPPTCPTEPDVFSSLSLCRVSCFKDRWEEVAP